MTFDPLVPKYHEVEDTKDLIEWLNRCRPELETKMELLKCTAAEAVMIMLLNRIASETIDLNEPPPGDEWKGQPEEEE